MTANKLAMSVKITCTRYINALAPTTNYICIFSRVKARDITGIDQMHRKNKQSATCFGCETKTVNPFFFKIFEETLAETILTIWLNKGLSREMTKISRHTISHVHVPHPIQVPIALFRFHCAIS